MSSSISLYRIITIIMGIIELIIGIRIILIFFDANTFVPFVSWIYQLSNPLIAPFSGIFPIHNFEGRFVIEISALTALIVYGLIGAVVEDAL